MEKRKRKETGFKHLGAKCRKGRARFFSEAHLEDITGYEHELQQGKLIIDVTKKIDDVSNRRVQQIVKTGQRYSIPHCDLNLK